MIAGSMSPLSDVPDVAALVADAKDGVVLRVHVRPRARRRGVLGVGESALVIGVGAAPERGRATEEAVRTLARWLGVAPSRLAVVSGVTSRSKRIAIAGLTAAEVRSRLSGLADQHPS